MAAKSARSRKSARTPGPVDQAVQLTLELAMEHHVAGRLTQAENIYQQVLQSNPDQPVALHLLGLIAHQTGKNDIAVELISKAIIIQPNYAEAHYNLGNALSDLGRPDEAVNHFRAALTTNPDFTDAHNNLGLVLQDLGQLDEAITCYQNALALKPDYAMAHRNLGLALQELGRLDEACASFRTAVSVQPDYGEAHRNLSVSKKFTSHDDDIKAMEKAYASPRLADEQKIHLSFALGKSFEDLKKFKESFQFYLTGNTMKRVTYDFSITSAKKYFSALKSVFTRELFAAHQKCGLPDRTPVFILGMPRSGTTLVEQIIASHPNVFGAGELNTLGQIITAHFGPFDEARFGDNINNADDKQFAIAAGDYIKSIRQHSESADIITDKMPHNFLMIGIIKLILPNAKIIHCCRDPRDTCLSVFKNYFAGDGHHFAYRLDELAEYYNLYDDLMTHWRNVVPGFIYDIEYEKLIGEQEPQTRALLAHCRLDWDGACLDFHKSDRSVQTASSVQVRKRIYKGSVQSWKPFEKDLEPLLDILKNH